jgi:CspA family cold shock protein
MSEEQENKNTNLTGKVVWFDPKRGFGFIKRDDGDKDMFVHYSNVIMSGYKTLEENQAVMFDIGTNKNGPQAINVRLLP